MQFLLFNNYKIKTVPPDISRKMSVSGRCLQPIGNYRNFLIRIILFFVFSFAYQIRLHARLPSFDTTYIEDHTTDLTVRVFSGYKFFNYTLKQKDYAQALEYKSNDNYILGSGFNYRFLGLNIAFKAPLVNNDAENLGQTKSLDLQSYVYMRRFTVDIYGQFYKGYYSKNGDILKVPLPDNVYLLRPDLRSRSLGFNLQYIFNNKRFSYRAAYLQNEYQKKSAGSAIAGIGVHNFSIIGDSAIIPSNTIDVGFFDDSRFNRTRVVSFSLNGGYVQSVVIEKHFFITAGFVGGVGLNATSVTDEKLGITNTKGRLQFNGTVRIAAGYNSDRYFAGLQYIDFFSRNAAPFSGAWQEFETGTFRVTLAKRFRIKRNIIYDLFRIGNQQ